MKKVCILLAAYNGEKYLREQLESILNQNEVHLDIYISLDLSTDGSYDLIRGFANLNNVFLLDYGAKYGSAGQNFFNLLCQVDFESYDYVAFSDQDDIWLSEKLSKSILLMSENNADAYSGNVKAFWEDGSQALVKKDYNQTEYDYLFESSGPGCSFVLSKYLAVSIKNSLLKKENERTSLWLHDWFCYSFARYNNYKWIIGSEPLMLYRQHQSNEVGANSGFKAILSRAKVVLSGEAFDKVKVQASFLEQNELPIKYLRSNRRIDLIKLLLISHKCRRKFLDKIFFALAIFILSVKN